MSFVKSAAELSAVYGRSYQFYDAEMVTVYWLTRPEIVKRLLPPPLQPAGEPLAYAFLADYPRTNFGPPYREGALFLKAQYEGEVGGYCLAMPVTGDLAMAGGREIFGYPKKMADIDFSKEDYRISGSLKRHGQRFFKLRADLAAAPNDDAFLAYFSGNAAAQADGAIRVASYLFKHFMAPDSSGFDYPPRLIRQETLLQPHTTAFGWAEINLPPSGCDPWYEVEVVTMLGAVYTIGRNEMLPGQVLAEVDEASFAPYAFLKWDN